MRKGRDRGDLDLPFLKGLWVCLFGYSWKPLHISILGSVYNSAAGKLLKKQEWISHLPCLLNRIELGVVGAGEVWFARSAEKEVLCPRSALEC